jgi:hypothetical protein
MPRRGPGAPLRGGGPGGVGLTGVVEAQELGNCTDAFPA